MFFYGANRIILLDQHEHRAKSSSTLISGYKVYHVVDLYRWVKAVPQVMFNPKSSTATLDKTKPSIKTERENPLNSSFTWKGLDPTEQAFFPQNPFVHQYNLLQSSSDFTSFHGTACDEGFLAGATQEPNVTFNFQSSNRYLSDNRTIHPMKICMIMQYFHENPQEHRLKCFDQEINMFKLVGLVRNLHIDESVNKWTFTLDDGTGVIQVGWLALRHTEYPDMECSPWMNEQLSYIKNNVYIRVYGDIDLLGYLKPHISAFFVSHIEIMDEIFYHDIQYAEWIFSRREISALSKGKDSHNLSTPSHPTPSESVLQTPDATPFSHSRTPKPIVKLVRKDLDPAVPLMDEISQPQSSFTKTSHENQVQPLRMSASCESILETLKNMMPFRPNGLTTDELFSHLVGRGLRVMFGDVKKELQYLSQIGKVMETSGHSWRLIESVNE